MAKKKGFEPRLKLPVGANIPSRKGKCYEIINGKIIGYPLYQHLLGCGGSGEVYLARDAELQRPVAIKIFIPLYQLEFFPKLSKSVGQDIEEEYRQEARSLSSMKHRNIVKLYDTDVFKVNELKQKTPFHYAQEFHYTVTEFVPGANLLDFLSDDLVDKSIFLKILIQTCNALIYLHEVKEYLHCDVKSSNIIVDPESLDVTLLDFALTRNLNFSEVKRSDKIKYFGDWDIFPQLTSNHLLRRMMETREALATRAQFKEHAFPRLDIYQFGILLERCKHLVRNKLTDDESSYLDTIVSRCKDFEKKVWWYNSINDLSYDIQKILPDYESPHRIRALGEAIRGQHIIQLPHHLHAVNMSEQIKKIIDSPQFQRLRTIYQLDLCHLTYPGATHTRFLHSLHCYEIMGDFLIHLASDQTMRMFLSENFTVLALSVALLHDIFHFPFLHVFEEIGFAKDPHKESLSNIDNLLLSGNGNGNNILAQLDSMNINKTALWGIIKGWPSIIAEKEKRLINSFIDGGVDIDKISYLFYDSYYTGVPDGVGLDTNKLLRSSKITRQEPYILSWRASGLSPIEQVIMARYQLFKKVYWNSDNRSAMARVKYTVMKLLSLGKITMERYVNKCMNKNQNEALLILDQIYKKEVSEFSPIAGLLPPKRISMIEISTGRYDKKHASRIKGIPDDDALMSLGGHDIVKVSDILARELSRDCAHEVRQGDVIVDPPGKKVDIVGNVLVDNINGIPTAIEELSEPVRHIGTNWQQHVKKVRVFVDETIIAASGIDKVRNCISGAMGWKEKSSSQNAR